MDSTWLQQDPVETPDSPLQLFPLYYNSADAEPLGTQPSFRKEFALTAYLLLIFSLLLAFPGCFLLSVVVSAQSIHREGVSLGRAVTLGD